MRISGLWFDLIGKSMHYDRFYESRMPLKFHMRPSILDLEEMASNRYDAPYAMTPSN